MSDQTQRVSKRRKKQELHPLNPLSERYDFLLLMNSSPALAPFVRATPYGELSIDFSEPSAVKALNRALLAHHYGVCAWDIPDGYLCPPIPGRADYLFYLADLLASVNYGKIPQGAGIRVLDVGIGANCVYPIIGHRTFGWRFVGAEIDPVSLASARQIVANNPVLTAGIECRLQSDPRHYFAGIIQPTDLFDLTLCNPPFHASADDAASGSLRKLRNLNSRKERNAQRPNLDKAVLNFGGQQGELWCQGGEAEFVCNMIKESRHFARQCCWFSSLVSKKDNLPTIYNMLKQVNAVHVQTIDMAQGQKTSRMVAWTFLSAQQLADWRKYRWRM